MSAPSVLDTRVLLLLALTALVIWFSNLDSRKLIKPDEGRYAEISREMAASRDWVTPRLNGIKYFEKPPLHYWVTATAFSLFGPHEWTARLWSALSGVLGVILAWYGGQRLFGAAAGVYAAVVLGSSLMYVVVGHLNTLDMGLTLFLFAALCAFLLAQRDQATARENAVWMHTAWAAMAGAVLSKGLVGIVIPGATLVLYTLIQRDWRPWGRLHLISGSLLFLAITAPWFVLVSMRNPEFAWFFFVHEPSPASCGCRTRERFVRSGAVDEVDVAEREPLIPKHGGYRKLKSFQVAQLVYDVTVRFCDRYISPRSRTHDQMVQAARSGVQNIAEGSQASGTSKKMELKLTNVARASLEELRLDYEDFLRQRGLPIWARDDPRRADLIARRRATADEVAEWVRGRDGPRWTHGRAWTKWTGGQKSTSSTTSTPSTARPPPPSQRSPPTPRSP